MLTNSKELTSVLVFVVAVCCLVSSSTSLASARNKERDQVRKKARKEKLKERREVLAESSEDDEATEFKKSPIFEERPAEVLAAVKRTYDALKDRDAKSGKVWNFHGGNGIPYQHFDLKPEQMIEWTIQQVGKKKNIRILDFGAGNFADLLATANLISEKFKHSGKMFHLYGVTGEYQLNDSERNDLVDSYLKKGIDLHLIQQAPIERISEILPRNRFDVIFTEKTMTHLVDPVGTLKELHSLLVPGSGILVTDQFAIPIEGYSSDESFVRLLETSNMEYLADHRNDHLLFRFTILKRKDAEPLRIALSYAGVKPVEKSGWHFSEEATQYRLVVSELPNYGKDIPSHRIKGCFSLSVFKGSERLLGPIKKYIEENIDQRLAEFGED